jgi:hypothetical protein
MMTEAQERKAVASLRATLALAGWGLVVTRDGTLGRPMYVMSPCASTRVARSLEEAQRIADAIAAHHRKRAAAQLEGPR